MTITRRKFIQLGTVTAFSAGALLSLPASAFEKSPGSMMDQIARARAREESKLSYAAFAACLNSQFTLVTENSSRIAIQLVEVENQLKTRKREGVRENFSLAFKAQSHEPLVQNTYQFEHEELGKFDLFIGPVKSGKHGYIYEAVINRI